ncbi:Hypothetical predicted protein, partial [Mytilus galloprovincialis]
MPRNRKFIKRNKYRKLQKRKVNDNTVINLSDTILTETQKFILSKGLSFSPTIKNQTDLQLLRDTLLFNRRIRLKHHFGPTTLTNQEPRPFKTTNGWNPPPGKNRELDNFLSLTTEEITTGTTTNKFRNVDKTDLKAIQELKNNPNLIIKPADKGGAIVILNKKDYLQEAERQLSDKKFYKPIPKDINPKIVKEIKEFIKL